MENVAPSMDQVHWSVSQCVVPATDTFEAWLQVPSARKTVYVVALAMSFFF
jgi:hypothetical protein